MMSPLTMPFDDAATRGLGNLGQQGLETRTRFAGQAIGIRSRLEAERIEQKGALALARAQAAAGMPVAPQPSIGGAIGQIGGALTGGFTRSPFGGAPAAAATDYSSVFAGSRPTVWGGSYPGSFLG